MIVSCIAGEDITDASAEVDDVEADSAAAAAANGGDITAMAR